MDRERQAWRELDRSSMSRGSKWLLMGVFVGVVGCVFAVDLWKPYGPRDAVRTFVVRDRGIPEERLNLLARIGDWNEETIADIGRFEAQIEEESVLRATVPFWQWLQARVLNSSGTARVLFGRDDWLFLRENVEIALGRLDGVSVEEADRAVRELAAILDEQGVELWIAPIPPKPEIEPDRFSGRFGQSDTVPPDDLRTSLYAGWERLPNVSVLPIRDLMKERAARGESSFLERDTHWTPSAMEAVAGMMAKRLGFTSGKNKYETRQVSGEGDLVRMLEMGGNAPFPNQTVAVNPWGGTDSESGSVDLILLGDSFSAVFSEPILGWGSDAGLLDQLREGYGISVKPFVNHGDPVQAPRQSLQRYLEAGGELPDRVVWQFAERFLNEGDWSWRMRE
mgnify:CR=1 FL=1